MTTKERSELRMLHGQAVQRVNKLRVDMYCGQATQRQVDDATFDCYELSKALGEGPPARQFVSPDGSSKQRRRK